MLQPLLDIGVLGLACDVLQETAITCVRRKQHRAPQSTDEDPGSGSAQHSSWSASDDDEDETGDTHWRQYRRDGPSCTPGKTPGGGRYTPYTTRGWQNTEGGDESSGAEDISDEKAVPARGYPISGAVADATLRLLEEIVNLPIGKAALVAAKPEELACTLDVACLGSRVRGCSGGGAEQAGLPSQPQGISAASCDAAPEADVKLDILSLLLLLFLHGNSAIKSGVLLVLVDLSTQAASQVVASHHARHFTTQLLEVCGDAKNSTEEGAAWFLLASVLQRQSLLHLQQQPQAGSKTAAEPVSQHGAQGVAVAATGGATWPVLLLRMSNIPFPDDCASYVATCVEAGIRLLGEESALDTSSDTATNQHSSRAVAIAARKALRRLRRRVQHH